MQPQLIAGRYQVLRSIGRGGMGTVWLCRDEVLGREVAIKQIGALPGDSATETKRAMREARSAAALNHPNAVAVYDVVDHEGRPWLVMEYVEGETLADEIARQGPLSPERVADIGAQLAGALARAHERRIVHRDIKPGNVLMDKAGRPKISDFGIARGHGDDQLTQIGFITGTPGYLSPELARGGDPHPASDVWALGATLYSAVEGQAPYAPRSNPIALLRAIASERPRPMTHAGAMAPAIEAMMDEDPARRWDMATSAKLLGATARNSAVMTPVLARTAVISATLEATQALGPTQSFEPVAPMVVAPRAQAPVVAPATKPNAAEPPVTTSPVAGPPESAPPVAPTSKAAAGPDRRWVPLGILALLVSIGVFYLMSHLGGPGGTTSGAGTKHKIAVAQPSAASTPTVPQTPRATSSAPSRVKAAPVPTARKGLQEFVRSYYADVIRDTGRTWGQLTPTMQKYAHDRTGYDSFWRTIRSVRVNSVQANASGTQARANLTFTRNDGSTSTESHQFTFVSSGGRHLIDSDRLVG
jgi:eukaryotic-like serine/threonine-protein kinase